MCCCSAILACPCVATTRRPPPRQLHYTFLNMLRLPYLHFRQLWVNKATGGPVCITSEAHLQLHIPRPVTTPTAPSWVKKARNPVWTASEGDLISLDPKRRELMTTERRPSDKLQQAGRCKKKRRIEQDVHVHGRERGQGTGSAVILLARRYRAVGGRLLCKPLLAPVARVLVRHEVTQTLALAAKVEKEEVVANGVNIATSLCVFVLCLCRCVFVSLYLCVFLSLCVFLFCSLSLSCPPPLFPVTILPPSSSFPLPFAERTPRACQRPCPAALRLSAGVDPWGNLGASRRGQRPCHHPSCHSCGHAQAGQRQSQTRAHAHGQAPPGRRYVHIYIGRRREKVVVIS